MSNTEKRKPLDAVRGPIGLRLHEAVLLLALRDEHGTTDRRAGMYRLAFGGAVLAELALEERIEVGAGKKALVEVAASEPLIGDPVLDHALLRIESSKRPRRATHWVGKLGNLDLRRDSAEGMCRRGILHKTESRILFAFTRTRFPTVDPAPEQALIDAIHAAIDSDHATVDPGLASLIGVAHAAGTLRVVYSRRDLKARRQRIAEISRDAPAARATRAAVEAVQAAVIAASAAVAVSGAS
jgi:hypothetical protein